MKIKMFSIILIMILYMIEKLSNSVCFLPESGMRFMSLFMSKNLCDDFCFAMLSSRIKKNLVKCMLFSLSSLLEKYKHRDFLGGS